MTGCRRAAPSIFAPLSSPPDPPRNCRIPQASPSSSPYPIPLSLAETSTTILVNRLGIFQPRCLVPPIAPPQLRSSPQSLAPLSPSGILDREDGEGRGAKDTAGVHPRRLRRPHLGPRCRSRYVIALGPPSSPTPSPLGLLCTRTHRCWKLSLASPAPNSPRRAGPSQLPPPVARRAFILPNPYHIHTHTHIYTHDDKG